MVKLTTHASRSGDCALLSDQASSAGVAICQRYQGSCLVRSPLAVWLLGYPQAADAYHAPEGAREIAPAASLMSAHGVTAVTCLYCADCAAAKAHTDEAVALADEKSALVWKALGMSVQGSLL